MSRSSKVDQIAVVYPDGAREIIYSADGTSTPGPISAGDFGTAAEYAVEASKHPFPAVEWTSEDVSTDTPKRNPPGSSEEITSVASPVWKAASTALELQSRTSQPAGKPSRGSMKHWRTPKNARELAAQMNRVATMLLNGDIDREVAHQYTQIMRPTVQAMSAVVYEARAMKEPPDLTLDDYDEEE